MNKITVLFLQFFQVGGKVRIPETLKEKFEKFSTTSSLEYFSKEDILETIFELPEGECLYLKDILEVYMLDDWHYVLLSDGRRIKILDEFAETFIKFKELGLWKEVASVSLDFDSIEWRLKVIEDPVTGKLAEEYAEIREKQNIAFKKQRFEEASRLRDRRRFLEPQLEKIFDEAFQEAKV